MQKIKLSLVSQCVKTISEQKKDVWITNAELRLSQELEKLPSGSGIDRGMKLLMNESKPERLVFSVPFHHIDTNGYYSGWTDYKLILKPSFLRFGIDMRITGMDRNYIKDYLYQLFQEVFEI